MGPDLKVKGVKGLRVADASIMPDTHFLRLTLMEPR